MWQRDEGSMVIKIGRHILEKVHSHAESAYPEECCGLLVAKDRKVVVDAVQMRNAFSGPRHDRYHIDPLEFLRAYGEAARNGMTVAGIYHSHPDHPATLSRFDIEHSFPLYSYVVVSVPNGEAKDTRSWLPNHDRSGVTEEAIEVADGRTAEG